MEPPRLDNFNNYDQEQPEDDDDEHDMTQLMNEIINVPTMIQRDTQKHKLLPSQVPAFKGQESDTMTLLSIDHCSNRPPSCNTKGTKGKNCLILFRPHILLKTVS